MFEGLSERLYGIFKNLRGKGKLTEVDVQEGLRQIRLVLLEADVNFRVVKDFIAQVRKRAVGQEVLKSLTPGQQLVKIVHEELIRLLGGEEEEGFRLRSGEVAVLLLAGLQGGGKTTTAAKLGVYYRKRGRKPLLTATDVHRPAAIKQLEVLGKQARLPVFSLGERTEPAHIARAALSQARREGHDLLIIDTSGRLHIDEYMMEELRAIREAVSPQATWLVLDAMTGQDAVNVATQFDETVGVDGFILTKLDGDARGGAALSIRAVTGKPIRFIGMGEKLDDLEVFHADRIASRILGLGDVLSLIERAEQEFDQELAWELERKIRTDTLDLNDFRRQLREVTKLGPLEQILSFLPGFKMAGPIEIDERKLKRMDAIISSMTEEERRHPEIIKGSRRARIARGSGTSVQEVNELLRQFRQMKKMFKQLTQMEKRGRGPRGREIPWLTRGA
ncbi:MAG TPA: signal recognition particle protein [Armatimonadetes bacterium]|nr:signal recognition particle protein [Armatimonadota bacterium]